METDKLVEVTQGDLDAAEAMLLDLCAPMTPMVANYAAVHFARYRLQAERDTLERAAKWLPIESAPKDGTVVLTNRGTAIYEKALGYCGTCWFLCATDGDIPSCADWGQEVSALHPTHWQPLPVLRRNLGQQG